MNVSKLDIAAFAILGVALVVSVMNFAALSGVQSSAATALATASQTVATPSNTNTNAVSSLSFSEIAPTGVPAIYGTELGISYDDISTSNASKADATINKLALLDTSIQLQGAELQRYVKIASSIACEYCCGANTLVNVDGSAACGCAHSYAMRGVGKYLIKQHGSEFSDLQILEEMGKWKVLFFPGPEIQKATVLKDQNISLNFVSLASNQYFGIEKGAKVSNNSTQQVGGC